MLFEWDEAKRQANITKHGLDLIDAKGLFDGRPTVTAPSPRDGEPRFVSVGLIGQEFFAIIWTERDEATRLISFRRARDGEKRSYRARFGRGGSGDA